MRTFGGRLFSTGPAAVFGALLVEVGVTSFELQLEPNTATNMTTTKVKHKRTGVQNFFCLFIAKLTAGTAGVPACLITI